MRGITKVAKLANLRSQKCSTCSFRNRCTPEIHRLCSDSFIEGFKKGAKFAEKQKKQQ
jgi:hypothetical protein